MEKKKKKKKQHIAMGLCLAHTHKSKIPKEILSYCIDLFFFFLGSSLGSVVQGHSKAEVLFTSKPRVTQLIPKLYSGSEQLRSDIWIQFAVEWGPSVLHQHLGVHTH